MLFKPNRLLLILFVFLLMFGLSLTRVSAQAPAPEGEGGVVAGDVVSPNLPTAATIGAAVSFLLAFSPWLSTWFKALPNATKRIIIFVLSVAAAVFLLLTQNEPGILTRLTGQDYLFFVQNIIAVLLSTQVQNEVVNRPLAKTDAGG